MHDDLVNLKVSMTRIAESNKHIESDVKDIKATMVTRNEIESYKRLTYFIIISLCGVVFYALKEVLFA